MANGLLVVIHLPLPNLLSLIYSRLLVNEKRAPESPERRILPTTSRGRLLRDRDRAPHRASSKGRGRFPQHVRNLDFRGLAGCRAVRAFAIGLPMRRSGSSLFS